MLKDMINTVICGDCLEVIKEIEDNSISLLITSPPYNVGMSYELELSEQDYYEFLLSYFIKLKRVLKPDGRICWNVPYQMYTKKMKHEISQWYLSVKALTTASLNIRDNITWNQSYSDNDTAWGSWISASSPWLRHQTEAIIIGYNQQWKKLNSGTNTITRDEFLKYVLDIWNMPCARRDWYHPAPFPEELPYRCIQLFSYKEDIILDTFAGSCTTAIAAIKTNRNWICIEKEEKYCEQGQKRIDAELAQGKLDL